MLNDAKDQLRVSSSSVSVFHHSVIRGDERAATLAKFFKERLPGSIGVAKAEAIDFAESRTGQLDLIIYDADLAAPITTHSENVLIPAESLLAVIEVKTLLTQDEIDKCFQAAAKVRSLKPFKRSFIGPRSGGDGAEDGNYRCMYIVFAYGTNLSSDDWVKQEFQRLKKGVSGKDLSLDLIDIVTVLDRGIVRPGQCRGKSTNGASADTFLEFYLHVVNFLGRERARRPIMDWQAYTTETSEGWSKLT